MAKNKKAVKKVVKKKTIKKKSPGTSRTTKKNAQLSTDIIFDSKIGKTDALFASDPLPENNGAKAVLPPSVKLDPAIAEALQEFDNLQQPNSAPEIKKEESKIEQPKKKSFWEKIMIFKK